MNINSDFIYTGTDNLEAMQEACNYNAFLSSLVSKHVGASSNVLDFGAGIGTFALPLHQSGCNIIAIEPDKNQLLLMQSLGLTCEPDLANVKNGWAQTIYSINVLEHIEDDHSALSMLASKLATSGKLFLYVPAFPLLYSHMDRKVGHYRRYTRKNLGKLVRDCGFDILENRYADSLGYFASLVYKMLGNTSGDLSPHSIRIYDKYFFPLSRIIDVATSRLFGKNLILIAVKR
jgi:SAM-dependent methyltransferase